jgi:two-component system, NarL family, sensor histidine kinase UhpB
MPNLSIRTRLNLLIGTLLILSLAANIAVLVWNANPRIRAENESIVKLTRQTVEAAVADLPDSPDPARTLKVLLDRLSGLRHVLVTLEPVDGLATAPPGIRQELKAMRVPGWFARLVSTDRLMVRIPVAVPGVPKAEVVIASNPADEIAEIWDAVCDTFIGGLVLIAAVFALTSLAVWQALRPVNTLSGALKLIAGGNFAVALDPTGPPELAGISSNVNDLAAALTRTRAENRALAEQLISLEDDERRELARELHDEFGPYLFAIRAGLSTLQTDAERDTSPTAAARRQTCRNILDHVSTLQQVNRRILQRLRPPALEELGLEGALHGLVELFREAHTGVAIELSTEGLVPLDARTELTVYRVVQEGLTNALRHAGASKIAVEITRPARDRLAIMVSDNGVGLASGTAPGFGLSGMAERVWAIGGTLATPSRPGGGLELAVALPITTLPN